MLELSTRHAGSAPLVVVLQIFRPVEFPPTIRINAHFRDNLSLAQRSASALWGFRPHVTGSLRLVVVSLPEVNTSC